MSEENILLNSVEDFHQWRYQNGYGRYCYELVDGRLLATPAAANEVRRLCFVLGTALSDHLISRGIKAYVYYGPMEVIIDERNVCLPDLFVSERNENPENGRFDGAPEWAAEILSENGATYECVDKAALYMKHGMKEYWLLDMRNREILVFSLHMGHYFTRYSFDETLHSMLYPGFEVTFSQLLWEKRDDLEQRGFLRKHGEQPMLITSVADAVDYDAVAECEQVYTAETFYDWRRAQCHREEYSQMVELLLGSLVVHDLPPIRYQNICGSLYFNIHRFLKANHLPFQACFYPIQVELKKLELLDSVVIPDLFVIPQNEKMNDSVYHGVPLWVIEIASPATAKEDYIDKAQLYQFHGVKEYWVVNDWKSQVMVINYMQPREHTTIYAYDELIPSGVFNGLEICMRDTMQV